MSLAPQLTSSEAKKKINDCLKNVVREKPQTEINLKEKLTPRETVYRIVEGLPYCLDVYKGKEEKFALLDYAIKSFDGNAITAIVIFLQKTLKTTLFNYEISKRLEAANHYVCYLKKVGLLNELIDVLTMLGRHDEAALMKYNQTNNIQNSDVKIRSLKSCYQSHFTAGGDNIALWGSLISQQISILERQLPVEMEDARQEREGQNPLFLQFPRSSLVGLPIISTLYYCCLYHYNLPENHFASPQGLQKLYQLSEKQFKWIALLALAKCQKWDEIEVLFQTKVDFNIFLNLF